jgi:hypothetical protein
MDKRELKIGDVVQINPFDDSHFGGNFMVVTEPKPWGAQGYCTIPGKTGVAYYRCPFEKMEYIGIAHWIVED